MQKASLDWLTIIRSHRALSATHARGKRLALPPVGLPDRQSLSGERGGGGEILRAVRGKRISRRNPPHPPTPPRGASRGRNIYFKTSLHSGVVVGFAWFGFLIDLGEFGDFQLWVDLRLGSPVIERAKLFSRDRERPHIGRLILPRQCQSFSFPRHLT